MNCIKKQIFTIQTIVSILIIVMILICGGVLFSSLFVILLRNFTVESIPTALLTIPRFSGTLIVLLFITFYLISILHDKTHEMMEERQKHFIA